MAVSILAVAVPAMSIPLPALMAMIPAHVTARALPMLLARAALLPRRLSLPHDDDRPQAHLQRRRVGRRTNPVYPRAVRPLRGCRLRESGAKDAGKGHSGEHLCETILA
jgi:hypothetical protein